ncbi:hypothetical protein HNR77_003910 [Paenibacillus sp. JGP012]|nr:hypothetical protein [Paenibacillus sp. JGP012]
MFPFSAFWLVCRKSGVTYVCKMCFELVLFDRTNRKKMLFVLRFISFRCTLIKVL